MRYRWRLTVIMFFGIAINYLDRINLSFVMPTFIKHFHFTLSQAGMMFSLWGIGFLIFALPLSRLGDRVSQKKLYGWMVAVWSVINMLTAGFANVVALGIIRFLLGVAESPVFPIGTRIVGMWFGKGKRGVPLGLLEAGIGGGLLLGAPICTLALVFWGWQAVFIVTGLLGLLWALVWAVYARENPKRHKGLSAQDRQYLAQEQDAEVMDAPAMNYGELLRKPAVWGLLVGFFGFTYIQYLYITWLPTYLVMNRHMTELHAGFMTMVPNLGTFLGAVCAGFILLPLEKRAKSPAAARRTMMSIVLVVAGIVTIPAAFASNSVVVVLLIALSAFLVQIFAVSAHNSVLILSEVRGASTLDGILQVVFGLGTFIVPFVTGLIVQSAGFVPAIVTAGVVGIVTAVAFAVLYKESKSSLALTPHDAVFID